MSIRRIIKKIKNGYSNSSFLSKVMWLFFICGLLPMLLSIIVYYNSMSRILMQDAYDAVDQDMDSLKNGLYQNLQPYETLMEMLKNDKSLYIQLNLDYSDTSYEELADYTDTTLENMMAMYPDLEGIHFYCSNTTLPSDEYYFFRKSELDSQTAELLEGSSDPVILYKTREEGDSLFLLSKMDYYTSSGNCDYLEFQIASSLLDNLLTPGTGREILILDRTGTILLNSEKTVTDGSIQEYLPDWDTLQADTIQNMKSADGRTYISMKSEGSMNLDLLILVDRESVLRNVRKVPLPIVIIFSVLLIISLILTVHQNRILNRKLLKIQNGMKAIGEGRFDEKIEDLGEDEFGLIARDVNQVSTQLDYLIRENYQKQLTIKSTELNLLQEQINPHFLYNALAVISSLAMQGNAKSTVSSIRNLADFYRISLNKGRRIITVREEIELLTDYMKIQLLRFSDLVEIDYEVAPEVEQYYTIKLLLQPLVENAIHHAREEEMFLSIHVKAYQENSKVCFDVEDNGMGIQPEILERLQGELQRQEEGFGLKNVDKRIKLAYGQTYGVTVFSVRSKGTRIHLEIPVMKER